MSTRMRQQPGKLTKDQRRQQRRVEEAARAVAALRRRRRNWLLWSVAAAVVIAIVATMMWTSRSTTSAGVRVAPDFTLTDTSGKQVHLADYRGHNVLLYFSEGAGCQPCITQMSTIEAKASEFEADDVTVLPIVMNTADQIRPELTAANVKTPFLIDSDGNVSRSYGVLGKGMHSDLPGHGFVLVDKNGEQRWYGEYPSMFVAADELLNQVKKNLS